MSFFGGLNSSGIGDGCERTVQEECAGFMSSEISAREIIPTVGMNAEKEFFDQIPTQQLSHMPLASNNNLSEHLFEDSSFKSFPIHQQKAFISRPPLFQLISQMSQTQIESNGPSLEEFQHAKQNLQTQELDEELNHYEDVLFNAISTTSFAEQFDKSNTEEYSFFENNQFGCNPNLFELAKQLHSEGKLTESILACEAAIKNGDSRAEVWALLGDCNCENEMENKAIAAYKKCIAMDPSSIEPLINLAVCLTNEGRELEALDLLNQWICRKYKLHYENDKSKTDLTEIFLNTLRNVPEAKVDTDLQLGLGLLKYNQYEYQRAIDCFEFALRKKPNSFILWNTLGATLANSGQNELALERYKKSLELRPGFIRTRHNLAIGFINIGCYDQAIKQLIKCLEIQTETGLNIAYTSESIWNTLRRVFSLMDKVDLVEKCIQKDISYFLFQLQ